MDRELNVLPAIAEKWTMDSTATIYSFKIRKDVYFHENECFAESKSRKVNSFDFLYSFQRLLSKELAAPGSWVFKNVKQFSCPDSNTFKIELKHPFPPFLGLLSMKYCSVIPKEAVDFYGANFRSNPVGTGPFYFKIWLENEKLVFRKNNNYFEKDEKGNSLPYLESIAISFIPDKQAAFLEFIKGNMDFISGIDASYKDELLNPLGELNAKYVEQFELYRSPYLNTEYLAFLMDSTQDVLKNSPLKSKKIRQAINYGFDRKKMMRYLRNNIGSPAYSGIIPKGLKAFDSLKIKGYTYQPELAAKLLEEAGFPNGQGLPAIKIQTNASYLDLCEYIQGELSKLGMNIEVEVSPPSTLRQAISSSKVDFFRASWIGDYPDSENYLSLFYSKNWCPNGPNYTHFKSELFDQWYLQSSKETNDSLRILLYQKMDSLVISEAPIVPLYYDEVLRFYPKTISGLEGNPMNLLDLKRVSKK
tara:strand:- start:621 stop:2045 length:1425 start_codon:yes stop_codon:yes gene_type:complete